MGCCRTGNSNDSLAGVSNVHRLRTTDRIFFVTVNLRRRIQLFSVSEYRLLLEVLEGSRRRLGFLLCGYVLIPQSGTRSSGWRTR